MQYLRVLKFSMYICTYTNYVIFMYNQQDFKYKAYIKNISTILDISTMVRFLSTWHKPRYMWEGVDTIEKMPLYDWPIASL